MSNQNEKHFRDARNSQTFLDVHDLSMNEDATTACAGRLLKQFLPGYSIWFENEAQRQTDFEVLLDAFTGVSAQLLASACMTISRGNPAAAAAILAVMEESLVRRLASHRENLLKQNLPSQEARGGISTAPAAESGAGSIPRQASPASSDSKAKGK